jgi:hypothetical protein
LSAEERLYDLTVRRVVDSGEGQAEIHGLIPRLDERAADQSARLDEPRADHNARLEGHGGGQLSDARGGLPGREPGEHRGWRPSGAGE